MKKHIARLALVLSSLAVLFLLAGACARAKEAGDEAKQKLAEAGDKASAAASSAADTVKEKAAAATAEAKDKIADATAEAKEKVAEAGAAVKDKVDAAAAASKDEAQQLIAKAKETGHSVVAATEAKTDAVSADVTAKRDVLVREAQHRMGAIDAGITTLQGKLQNAQGSAKQELSDQIAALRAKRAAVRAKMIELGKASGAAWDDLAAGLKAAELDLEKAIDDALVHFSK